MKNRNYYAIAILLLNLVYISIDHTIAQDIQLDSLCPQRDLSDVLRKALNKPPKVKSENTSSFIAFPKIGSNPATGFMVGLGGAICF